MDLPVDIIELVFSHLTYDEISKTRLVCKQFNLIGKEALNHGFRSVRQLHGRCLREIKRSFPRRESERRKHALYPRHDVLQAVETRLSLLSMTYSRNINLGACCFIPGKVLDELFRILSLIQRHNVQLPSSVHLLQELRDISSMAMEHFDEFVEPTLQKQTTVVTNVFVPKIAGIPEEVMSDQSINLDDSQDQINQGHPYEGQERLQEENVTRKKQSRKISALTLKVMRQSRTMNRMNEKMRHLENVVVRLSQIVCDSVQQLSQVVEHVNSQPTLPSKSSLILSSCPGTSGDFNQNFIRMDRALSTNSQGKLLPSSRKRASSSLGNQPLKKARDKN